MAGPSNEFQEDVESDRDIQPLAVNASRLPFVFFVVAVVAALLVLFLLQLFSSNNTATEQIREEFRPPTANIEIQDIPRRPVEPVIEPEPKPEPETKPSVVQRFNPIEMERLRQIALLEEQKQELERQRLAAIEAERRERLASNILIVDSTTDDSAFDASAAQRDEFSDIQENLDALRPPDPNDQNELIANANERFLRDASDAGVAEATAVTLENQDTLITQGTFISGVLETAINSDLPGMIRAIVDQNVYGRTGQVVVIPKGSRLVGRYNANLTGGQARVFVVWSRLERPDGVVADIGSPGVDGLGVAGLGGFVDNHIVERFGAATFLTVLGPLVAVAGESIIDSNSEQAQSALQDSQQNASRVAEIALENSISRPPTIHVDQGARINVFVNRDISFHSVGLPTQ